MLSDPGRGGEARRPDQPHAADVAPGLANQTAPGHKPGRHSRGVRVIFLKRTSDPSDWNWSLPLVTPRSVALLTVTPLSRTVIVSAFMVTTSVFHSPTPFSTSFLPRKPRTFSQAGSRPNHSSRSPGPNSRAAAPSFQ